MAVMEDRDELLDEQPDVESTVKLDSSRCSSLRRVVTVEPVLFLYFLSFGSLLPTLSQYVYLRIGEDYGITTDSSQTSSCVANKTDPEYILQQEVQGRSAQFLMLNNAIPLLPAFVMTALLGPYSDAHGRKYGIMTPVLGMLAKTLTWVCVVHFHLPLWCLLAGTLVDSLTGSITCVLMASFAYISDITSHKNRAIRIFIAEVFLGIAIAVGPMSTGFIIRFLKFEYSFFIAQCICVLNFIVVLFYLKEPITRQSDVSFLTLDHFKKIYNLFRHDDGSKRRGRLIVCGILLLLACMVILGMVDVQTYFLLDAPLCFTSITLGYVSAYQYALTTVMGLLVLKLSLAHLKETTLMLMAIFSGMGQHLVMAFAVTFIMPFIAPMVGCLSSLVIPLLRAIMSKLVQSTEQGALFASIAMVQQLGQFFASLTFNSIYTRTVAFYPGLVYFITAGVWLILAALTIWLRRLTSRHHEQIKKELIGDTEGTIN